MTHHDKLRSFALSRTMTLEGARLQPCHVPRLHRVGFSPWGMPSLKEATP